VLSWLHSATSPEVGSWIERVLRKLGSYTDVENYKRLLAHTLDRRLQSCV